MIQFEGKIPENAMISSLEYTVPLRMGQDIIGTASVEIDPSQIAEDCTVKVVGRIYDEATEKLLSTYIADGISITVKLATQEEDNGSSEDSREAPGA